MAKTTVGQAADTDTLVASANAYLSALNKMIIKETKLLQWSKKFRRLEVYRWECLIV
jgi:2-isopropylmalate synthase